MPERNCLRCNTDISDKAARAKYCSRSCKNQAGSDRTKRRARGEDLPFIEYGTPRKPCAECGEPKRQDYLDYCSRECQRIGNYKRKGYSLNTELVPYVKPVKLRKRTASPSYQMIAGSCAECGDSFVSKETTKQLHSKVSAKYCSALCSKRAANRNEKHKRRAQVRLTQSAPIYRWKIYERDNWTCHICTEPVDQLLTSTDRNHDYAASLDHLVPLSKGGEHTSHNLKLAHRLCNSYKNDTLAA